MFEVRFLFIEEFDYNNFRCLFLQKLYFISFSTEGKLHVIIVQFRPQLLEEYMIPIRVIDKHVAYLYMAKSSNQSKEISIDKNSW